MNFISITLAIFGGALALAEWFWALLVGILATVLWLRSSKGGGTPAPPSEAPGNLTMAFQSAIPTLTKELNLEVATAEPIENLTLEDPHWTGTNRVEITVPVTYRFHICLRDAWEVRAHGSILVVTAPAIRTATPPAIHLDKLEIRSNRGGIRLPPTELKEKALKELLPTLSAHAGNERRVDLIRETARSAVQTFVRQWLVSEKDWGHKFHAIEVDFAADPAQIDSPPSSAKRPPERQLK